MSYLYLALAISLEVMAVTCMKLSKGFTHLVPSVLMFVFYGGCFGIFVLALRKIEISLAYAIWAGLGTALVAVVGMAYFKEPVSLAKILSIALIIIGVISLHLSS